MVYNYQKIWRISYPILIGLIMHQLIGLTDTAFMGRVGEVELGASAIAGVFYIMIFMLGQGFGIGVQIIIARRNGEKRFDKIGPTVYQGISFLLAAAVILVLFSQMFTADILRLLINSPEIFDAAKTYLDYRVYGLLFAFTIVIFRAFYIGITETKVLTWNSIVMLLANVALDYILIFGKLGFPAMGIKGAAIASVLAEVISLLFYFLYTYFTINRQYYGFDKIILWNSRRLKSIFDISSWTMLQSFISLSTWFLFFVAVEHLGSKELAISNILRSISTVTYMIVVALGAAASSITSNLIGRGRDDQVLPTATRIVWFAYLLGLSVIAVTAVFPVQTMRIYTDKTTLIYEAVPAFYMMLTTYLTVVPGMIYFNVVSGTGNTRGALMMELAGMAVYMFNVWYLIWYLRTDIFWAWSCEHSYNILLWALSYRYLQQNRWCCKIV